MAACPVAIPASPASPTSIIWRRPIALSPRRIEANRRNASRSTGPRTPKGKARVARNAIKHGFFASTERWTLRQHRDFEELMAGLREDFQPRDTHEDGCVATIAASYVRMAALWRYENIAARKHHEECTRDLDTQIAMAESAEAEALRAHREELRRAGLWGPTIPAPREAAAICRYQGKLDRTIRAAMSDLPGLKASRAPARHSKAQKQTHLIQETIRISGYSHDAKGGLSASIAAARHRSSSGVMRASPHAPPALPEKTKNAKTNPLNATSTGTLTGNRHQRRKAKALARGRRC
jgi:hypothetical protein